MYAYNVRMTANLSTRKRSRPRLTRELIAAEALALIDSEGLDALNMRELAGRLDAGTMSLYRYFGSKRELLDAAVDAAAADFEPPAARGKPRTRLLAYLRAVREWLQRHPAVIQLRVREAITRPSAFAISEQGVQILLDAGLSPAQAAPAFRLLFNFVFGNVAFAGPEPTAEQRAQLSEALGALPADAFPALTTVGDAWADALGGRAQFEYEANRILDGLGL
jgi:AcrR family transcriptional regulator